MLTMLLSWLRGYVVLHITGANRQDRFLNLALQRDIDIYDINWLSEEILELKAAYGELGRLKKIAKITGCTLKARRSTGLPFVYKYLWRRKSLAVGIILFGLGLFVFSQVIFDVQVVPREELKQLDSDVVLEKAQELGIRPGAFMYNLDTDRLAKIIQADIDELSWVYISRQGTVVNIEIAERSIYPDELENATLGAIWANRDALIEDVLVKHGQPMVSHGDTVRKGTLLVSPLADGRADAIIKARVWYEGYGEGALREKLTREAGLSRFVYYIMRGENRLTLWDFAANKNQSNMQQKVARQELPFNLQEEELKLCQDRLTAESVFWHDNTEEEAKAKAYAQAKSSLEAQLGEAGAYQLLDEQISWQLLSGGIWAANVRWECLEEIGERSRSQMTE